MSSSSPGTIIVSMNMRKKKFLPLNLYLEKAKPAMEATISCRTVVALLINSEFMKVLEIMPEL